VLLSVLAAGVWAKTRADALLHRTLTAHDSDIPMPWPLTDAQRAALPEGTDADAVATQQALARGEHLLAARYGCTDCHGADLGGGSMLDDPAVGSFPGSNLTTGSGGYGATATLADWEHKLRHGINRDGRPGPMPSDDFFAMSDQELSDLVLAILARPPVDREPEQSTYGPIGWVLLATGQFQLAADKPAASATTHVATPPAATPTAEFGAHLAATCTGCHRPGLQGGPVVGGAPEWPPATNLTTAPVRDWSFEDFRQAMQQGTRPDGSEIRDPMRNVLPLAQRMTDTELRALWAYVQGLDPVPTGG